MDKNQIKEIKDSKCIKCKNKNSLKCEIHQKIDGNLKCLYEEEEKDEC